MSRLDEVKEKCAGVVSDTSYGLSETWQYRLLTSKTSEAPTYSEWVDVVGLASGGNNSQEYDPDRQMFKNVKTSRFRTAESAILDSNQDPVQLKNGDQLKDGDDVVWAVSGISSSGPGTLSYSLTRERALKTDADRKGGV